MTSISDLQGMTQTHYNAGQNTHYEQGHNAAHLVQQGQQNPYYSMPNMPAYPPAPGKAEYPGYLTKKPESKENIEELVKDINDSLPDDTFSSLLTEEEQGGNVPFIPPLFREPLLILVLFIILSLPVVKSTLGSIIPQINADETGAVGFAGVVIYGILLAGMFSVIKKWAF